jgi:hypothetical protein
LEPRHAYILDDEEILEEIFSHYLYAAYPIDLNGARVPLLPPQEWQERGMGETADVEASNWLAERYDLHDMPILSRRLRLDNGGWVTFLASGDQAPPFEVYRRGILVCREELIPEPFNLFITGLVDMENIAVKPDRETLYRDADHARLIRTLHQECQRLTIDAVKSTSGGARNIVMSRYSELTLTLQRDETVRNAIGLLLPLETFRPDLRGRAWQPIETIIRDQQQDRCLYWTDNRNRDALFADRLLHLEKIPVVLAEPEIKNLVMRICKEQAIPAFSVARDYLDYLRANSVAEEDFPDLQSMFNDALDDEWEIVLVSDADTRFPLRLIPQDGDLIGHDATRRGLGVVNVSSKPIQILTEIAFEMTASDQYNFVRDLCSIAKIPLQAEDVAQSLQETNTRLLRRHGLLGGQPMRDRYEKNSAERWVIEALQDAYENLIDAVRQTLRAYQDGEPNHMLYLREEIRLHPVVLMD